MANQSVKSSNIRSKITKRMIAMMLVSCITLGVVFGIAGYSMTLNTMSSIMEETALVSAEFIAAELKQYIIAVELVGSTARLTNDSVSLEEKEQLINERKERYGFALCSYIDTTGQSIFEGVNLSEREYFKEAMKGNTYVSDPVYNKVNNAYVVVIASPLWDAGIVGTEIKGVVSFAMPVSRLAEMVSSVDVGTTGITYIINKSGLMIAHPDTEIIGVNNHQEMVKTDSGLKQIAAIEKRMTNGEEGFETYRQEGVSKAAAFCSILETNGWSICVTVKMNEFLTTFYIVLGIIAVVVIFFIALGVRQARSLGKSISEPINLCVNSLKLLSEGNLNAEVPVVHTGDETQQLLEILAYTISRLNEIIKDVDFQLSAIAGGDLRQEFSKNYSGDFNYIKESILKIQDSLNSTMTKINKNANIVSEGSSNLSEAAQSLADGATDQASSIQELTAMLSTISSQTEGNERETENATQKINEVAKMLNNSNEQMMKLIDAMTDIQTASSDIESIIKTIESIAGQTNLLSLNASIEAARAGESGRGFAVVANEVGSLAGESQKAVKDTSILINKSIEAVQTGSRFADNAARSISEATNFMKSITDTIDKINYSSKEQSLAVKQASEGIEQISHVIESNAAASEESAASSEELSAGAEVLKSLVEQFKIK